MNRVFWLAYMTYALSVGWVWLFPCQPFPDSSYHPLVWVALGGISMIAIVSIQSYLQTDHHHQVLGFSVHTIIMAWLTHIAFVSGWNMVFIHPSGVTIPCAIWPEWIACGTMHTWSTLTFFDTPNRVRLRATVAFAVTMICGFLATVTEHVVMFVPQFVAFLVLLYYLIGSHPSCRLSIMLCILYCAFPVVFIVLSVFRCSVQTCITSFLVASAVVKSCIVTLVYQDRLSMAQRREEEHRQGLVRYIFHELRTPLHSIQLAVDVLSHSNTHSSPSPSAVAVNGMQIACRHVQDTLNNVLCMHQCESKQVWKVTMTPIRLSELVNLIQQTMQPIVYSKRMHAVFDLESSTTDSTIVVDVGKLTHILVNLWSNALKYTPERGRVKMTMQLVRASTTSSLIVRITDSGCGIPREKWDMLFRHFSQVGSSTSETSYVQSSGLGLWICRQLAEVMGGTIEICQSVVGAGSTFQVTLPVTVTSNMEQKSVGFYEELTTPIRALVVDDHPMNRRLMGMLLEKLGVRVDHASNGREAIHLTTTNNYDVVFLDHVMPEMTGVEVAHQLRQVHAFSRFIIGVTGNAFPEDVQLFQTSGADMVLIKPTKLEDLRSVFSFIDRKTSKSEWFDGKRLHWREKELVMVNV